MLYCIRKANLTTTHSNVWRLLDSILLILIVPLLTCSHLKTSENNQEIPQSQTTDQSKEEGKDQELIDTCSTATQNYKTKILMPNGSLMKVESIAECSPWSILQYFWPALSDNWSWKTICGLFESGCFTQVLQYHTWPRTQYEKVTKTQDTIEPRGQPYSSRWSQGCKEQTRQHNQKQTWNINNKKDPKKKSTAMEQHYKDETQNSYSNTIART